jgi:hypothetical protein
MSYGTMRGAKTVIFTVEGKGTFPIDMLRYDACYPASEADSYATMWDVVNEGYALRRVTLKHRVSKDANLHHYPTEDRWKSFMWKVVPGSIEYDRL